MPAIYTSDDDDNTRWFDFAFREGDIVISTRSKHGTTWMQMICALLVFESEQLPAPLTELSPWLDHTAEPVQVVRHRLAAQAHRRFIKSHTPLDGLPMDPRATYVVVARHPLDAAVSLYHQSLNIDRRRLAELVGMDPAEADARPAPPPLDQWLREWIAWKGQPAERLESLPGVLHHVVDAWERQGPNVVLVHYADLLADLPAQMRRLADALGFDIGAERIGELSVAATFDAMRDRSDQLAPDALGVLKDRGQFFREGRSGQASEILESADLAAYEAHAASLAPPEVLTWLHR